MDPHLNGIQGPISLLPNLLRSSVAVVVLPVQNLNRHVIRGRRSPPTCVHPRCSRYNPDESNVACWLIDTRREVHMETARKRREIQTDSNAGERRGKMRSYVLFGKSFPRVDTPASNMHDASITAGGSAQANSSEFHIGTYTFFIHR